MTLFLIAAALLAGPATAMAQENAEKPLKIVALGDSLTAGYMLNPGESFPAQLQAALNTKGIKAEIVNAGVSGDTTSGGLERLAWSLDPKPDAVILELGANDALRGIDPATPRANLDKILQQLKEQKIPVLLAGMKAPGNWGPDYRKAFDAIYPDLAQKYETALYPFFLDGVALNPAFVLDDGMHPSATGVAEIVKRILPDVEALLEKAQAQRASASN